MVSQPGAPVPGRTPNPDPSSEVSFLRLKGQTALTCAAPDPAEGQRSRLRSLKGGCESQTSVEERAEHPERTATEPVSLIHRGSACLPAPPALCHGPSSILRRSILNDLLFTVLS